MKSVVNVEITRTVRRRRVKHTSTSTTTTTIPSTTKTMPSPTTTTTNALIVHRHQSLLLRFAVLSRAVTFLLLQLTVRLALFDASPLLVSAGRPFLRWDTFHFLHVAEQGYAYEHEWAFFPGVPIVMHAMANLVRLVHTSERHSNLLLGGVAAAITCDTTRTFYALSLHHLQSPQLAFLASLLSLLPSSPVTLQYAPYSEPFFTYFSYKGELLICSLLTLLLKYYKRHAFLRARAMDSCRSLFCHRRIV
jgi:phosphatidylinositol glycan class V